MTNAWVDGAVILDFNRERYNGLEMKKLASKIGVELLGTMMHGRKNACDGEKTDMDSIYPGCPAPMVRELYRGQMDRKRNNEVPNGTNLCFDKKKEHAVPFLIRTCREAIQQVTIVVLGELTNLAVALQIAPDIALKIREVLVLDRKAIPAIRCFAVDPEAGQIVIGSGIPLTVVLSNEEIPLNVPAQTEREVVPGKEMYLSLERSAGAGVLIPTGKIGNIRIFEEDKEYKCIAV